MSPRISCLKSLLLILISIPSFRVLSQIIPNAHFEANAVGPCVGDLVNFTAVYAGNSGNQTTYTWDFGDGNSTGPNLLNNTVSHAYAANGLYTVTLTITETGANVGTGIETKTDYIIASGCAPINSEQGNWFFGNHCGLNFASGIPTVDPGAYLNQTIQSDEATAVQSDANGNLLFYTDNVSIWDNTHTKVNTGNNLLGHQSATQGALILKDPASNDEYYIFHVPANSSAHGSPGFRYTKVLANNGGISLVSNSVNVPILAPSNFLNYAVDNAVIAKERITAIPNCNGYWVITCGIDNTNNGIATLMIYNLTNAGLNFHSSSPIGLDFFGQIKVAPNGTKIAVASWGFTANTRLGIKLFDFDQALGMVSNPLRITLERSYGLSFSPDSKALYATEGGYPVSFRRQVVQYDLSTTNIGSSKKIISDRYNQYFGLQLGPNGKIYGSNYSSGNRNLFVIHNPNYLVTTNSPNACVFDFGGQALNNTTTNNGISSNLGLPNMVDAKSPNNVSISFTGLPPTLCANDLPVALTGVPAGGIFSGPGIVGNTFDPSQVLAGNPIRVTYTVFSLGCSNSSTQNTTVNAAPNVSFTGLDQVYCSSEAIEPLSGSPLGGTFNGVGIVSNNFNPTIASLGLNDVIYNYIDSNGCTGSDTQVVKVNGAPEANFSAPMVCVGDTTHFSDFSIPNGGCAISSWNWDFAGLGSSFAQNPFFIFPSAGNYSVCLVVKNCNNCIDTICKNIVVNDLPGVLITPGGPVALCPGDSSVTLHASGGVRYVWSNGLNSQDIIVHQRLRPGIASYSVEVVDTNGCINTANVTVNTAPNLFFSAGPDVKICEGDTAILQASNALSWVWSTGQTTQNISVIGPGIYSVNAILANGCPATDNVIVSMLPWNSKPCKNFRLSMKKKIITANDAKEEQHTLILQEEPMRITVSPNPFQNSISFAFVPSHTGSAQIVIYDLLGTELLTLFDDFVIAGKSYSVDANLYFPDGVYIFSLVNGKKNIVAKLIKVMY